MLLQPPTKEVDVEFLVFVERYVTDLLRWDILACFAHQPDLCASASTIAKLIGRNVQSVYLELGDLALVGILEQFPIPNGSISYRLTEKSRLKESVLKFAVPQV